jgi:hypothetical protein
MAGEHAVGAPRSDDRCDLLRVAARLVAALFQLGLQACTSGLEPGAGGVSIEPPNMAPTRRLGIDSTWRTTANALRSALPIDERMDRSMGSPPCFPGPWNDRERKVSKRKDSKPRLTRAEPDAYCSIYTFTPSYTPKS